ncbi:MAG: DUF4198 domain-containing protein [Kiritimatiellae bacterium]|nr:DUF4198 domain-containing protein [Kiritimatiellia bacterium]
MKRGMLLLAVIGRLGIGAVCLGHGMTVSRIEEGVGIRAVYDDGSPVSFSEVKVFSPEGAGKPFFTGTTDRQGYFLFRPDTNGVWRVAIDDGMGHAVTHEIVWDGTRRAAMEVHNQRMPRAWGALAGLAMIFGIFGWGAFVSLKYRPALRR